MDEKDTIQSIAEQLQKTVDGSHNCGSQLFNTNPMPEEYVSKYNPYYNKLDVDIRDGHDGLEAYSQRHKRQIIEFSLKIDRHLGNNSTIDDIIHSLSMSGISIFRDDFDMVPDDNSPSLILTAKLQTDIIYHNEKIRIAIERLNNQHCRVINWSLHG